MSRAVSDRFEQRKATRGKLVEAALKLFSTSGYEHATVDDISQEAGYSKGAYYFHFSTKDDILIELLRMWSEDRTAALAAGGGGGEPVENLEGMLEGLFSYDDAPRWPAVLLEFWSQSQRNAEVSKRLTQSYAEWRRELAEAFAAAGDGGGLQITSSDDAASVALAAHDGQAVHLAIGFPGGQAMTAGQLARSLIAPMQAPEVARAGRAAAM